MDLVNVYTFSMISLFFSRLYSDYIFEARFLGYHTSPSNFHTTVLDVIHGHEKCQRENPIRACVYKRRIDQYKVGSAGQSRCTLSGHK